MKFVSPDSARAIILFAYDDIRPLEGLHVIDFGSAIADRYAFSLPPTREQMLDQNHNAIFSDGKVKDSDGLVPVRELTIGRGGMAVVAATTDHCDRFLKDFFGWLESHFRFRNLDQVQPPIYLSSIAVEFDAPIERHIRVLGKIVALFNNSMKEQRGEDLGFRLRRLAIGRDPGELPASKAIADFLIETREGWPHHPNRYYCFGPATTNGLTALMEEFEKIITSEE